MSVRSVKVYGNVNDDVTFCLGEPYHDAGLFGETSALKVVGSQLLVGDGGFLSIPYEGQRIVFSLQKGIYEPGNKCNTGDAVIMDNDDIQKIADRFGKPASEIRLSRGQSGWPLPGGGGPNVGRGIYRIFRGLKPRSLIATCSKQQEKDFRVKLSSVWGGDENLVLYPLDIPIGVNAIMEGLGTHLDRNIFRGPQDRNAPLGRKWEPIPSDGVHVVNTIYNHRMAVYALTEALSAEAMIIACTESLCSKVKLDDALSTELTTFVNQRLDLAVHGRKVGRIQSVHHFLREFVLPYAHQNDIPPLWIFNETEFGWFLDTSVWMRIGEMTKHIIAQEILRGFKKFRQLERRESDRIKSVVIVTCGNLGAFVLDAKDNLHFCNILDLNAPVQEKNAIGDLFASIVSGVMAGGIWDKSSELPSPDPGKANLSVPPDQRWVTYSLLAASAGADSGVYDGFRHVTVASLNSRLSQKAPDYAFFGPLDNVSIANEENVDLKSFVRNRIPKMNRAGFKAGDMPKLRDLVDPSILSS